MLAITICNLVTKNFMYEIVPRPESNGLNIKMEHYNEKFARYGDLYEVIDNLEGPLSPNKYYIYMGVKGQTPRVVKGSELMKEIPRSPLKPSNGRLSRLGFVEEERSPLKESNGRMSRLDMHEENDVTRYLNF